MNEMDRALLRIKHGIPDAEARLSAAREADEQAGAARAVTRARLQAAYEDLERRSIAAAGEMEETKEALAFERRMRLEGERAARGE